MKKGFSEEQIIKVIKQHDAGGKGDDICRDISISSSTFYNWRSKYAGMEVNEAKRLKELESENHKLKKVLADKLLEVEAMKDVLSKKVVTPAARKPVTRYFIDVFKLSERVACKLAGVIRTGVRYYQKDKYDDSIRLRLKELASQYPRYGYLMLHGLPKREGLVVNRKHTYHLYTEEALQVRTEKRKKLARRRQPIELPSAPNQRWPMDIVSGQLSSGRRFRVPNVIDDFS